MSHVYSFQVRAVTAPATGIGAAAANKAVGAAEVKAPTPTAVNASAAPAVAALGPSHEACSERAIPGMLGLSICIL